VSIERSCLNVIADPLFLPQRFFIFTYKTRMFYIINKLENNEGDKFRRTSNNPFKASTFQHWQFKLSQEISGFGRF
jgi:hypothetical protein